MNKVTIPISGMHCRSCELAIENKLVNITGVKKVIVSQKNGCAKIYYLGETINATEIEKAIQQAGYRIGSEDKKPFISKNPQDYMEIILSAAALLSIYILLNITGLGKFFSTYTNQPSSLLAVLLIGVTAGFSTCMALVGGLVLGAASSFAKEHPEVSPINRFQPHLFFNAGRIVSYIIFGGVIGMLGSVFQLSGFGLGIITLAVALLMFSLGLQLTGLFPQMANFSFTLPKNISRLLGINIKGDQSYSPINSVILGGLTFFLPCGFTQAMQLYAIASGSFVRGALIMGIFALGTAPGLLSLGGLTSVVRGIFAHIFFKFAGVVVIAFSLFNASNGLNLLGWNPFFPLETNPGVLAINTDPNVTLLGNIQIVRMNQTSSGYEPNTFTIQKGMPVKWVINSLDPLSCASSLISTKLNIRKTLQAGENIIEFTPQEAGQINFSCSMGMYRGVFNVVDKDSKRPAAIGNIPIDNTAIGHSCSMGGCGCGGTRKINFQE